MAHTASPSLVRQLGSLFEGGSVAGLCDRQLVERFNTRGEPADEAAFAAMVARHGPMVLGVCRQLLGDHHHAEDAFQAVFLVLARKARSIRDPDRLGTWLYGVALRTARRARAGSPGVAGPRNEDADRRAGGPHRRAGSSTCSSASRAEALHREIDRLPGAFRVPVVLCYFEGLTLDEAAHRLRWPAGTLRSRLARARREAPSRPRAPRLRAVDGRAGAPVRPGVRLIPPVRFHDEGRDRFRGPSRRRWGALRSRRGPGPGGPEIHARSQAQAHRDVPVAPGRRRHRRRLPQPPGRDGG